MAGPNPISQAEEWFTCTLAGKVSPGWVQVSGADRVYDWQEKSGPGAQGGTRTYRGQPLAEFELTLSFGYATGDVPDDFDSASAQAELVDDWVAPLFIDGTKVKAVTGIAFYHPATAKNGITSVVAKSIGQWSQSSPGGVWTFAIKLGEFRPASTANATKTPSTSKGTGAPPGSGPGDAGGGGGDPLGVDQKQDEQIKKLQQEWEKP